MSNPHPTIHTYSAEEIHERRTRTRRWALRRRALGTVLQTPGPFESLSEALNPKPERWYPFCDTTTCPWWRGYCSRDPSCDN